MKKTNEHFLFTSHSLPNAKFYVLRFKGTERINEAFSFDITLICKDNSIDTEKLMARKAVFSISDATGKTSDYPGFITEISNGGSKNGYVIYQIVFRSLLGCAKDHVGSVVLLNKTLQDSIEEIIGVKRYLPFNHEFHFYHSYPVQEFSMIYNESYINYMLWKLEEQGAYCYFDGDRDTYIFADSPQSHDISKGIVRFLPNSSMNTSEDNVLTSFMLTQKRICRKVVVRSYNWQDPNKMLVAEKEIEGLAMLPAMSIVDTKENVSTQYDAERIAKIRAEEISLHRSLFTGTGTASFLRPGFLFTVADHPNTAFNRDYLVTEITHEGNQEELIPLLLNISVSDNEEHFFYRNSFTCIKSDVQFRPARRTPRAVISGIIHAFIDGDNASTPVLDKYGRYKLLFPFDLSGKADGKASCWIRRAQEQVGKDSGMTFPLLPGTEVAVAFLDGNPDQPYIIGALANGETGSLSSSANNNFSGIRTPGGAQITFDNEHNGISLGNLTGSGIKFGSGSMDYMQSETHLNLNMASVGCSDVVGLFKDTISGFSSSNSVECGSVKNYIIGAIKLALTESLKDLSTLASTATDQSEAKKYATEAKIPKLIALLLSLLAPIMSAKKSKKGLHYNMLLSAEKDEVKSLIRCFPSTPELITNIVFMLTGRLATAATAGADAQNQKEMFDNQSTGDINAYQTILLESIQTVYDINPFSDSDEDIAERKKYNGDSAKGTIGEYYTNAETSPCAYYTTASAGLTKCIQLLDYKIDLNEDKLREAEIKMTDPAESKENQQIARSDYNSFLVEKTAMERQLNLLQNLSSALTAQYNNSCTGEQTKEAYYSSQKKATVRSTVSSQISAFLPELVAIIALLMKASGDKKHNVGGILIDAKDKNINLHAKTYIGQHAERGIYLNTLKAECNKNNDMCGTWASPRRPADQISPVDTTIADIFSNINDQKTDGTETVEDFIKKGHANRRAGTKVGDTVADPSEKDTTFIASQTHLFYSKSDFAFHVPSKLFSLTSEKIDLSVSGGTAPAYLILNKKGDVLLEAKHNIMLKCSDSKSKHIVLNPKLVMVGTESTNGDTIHGLAVSDKEVVLAQKLEGNKPSALELLKEKATLGVGKDTHITVDGSKDQVTVRTKTAIIAGLCFQKNKISKANGGCLIFGDNAVKISKMSSVESKAAEEYDNTLKSIATLFSDGQPDEQSDLTNDSAR